MDYDEVEALLSGRSNLPPARNRNPNPDPSNNADKAVETASSKGSESQVAGTTTTTTTATTGRKRDGTRKGTRTMTPEQLERKRANDREAQRTIRQRTKEHIENLEHQVAELRAKGEQMERVMQRNAVLEAEIAHLRQQLAVLNSKRAIYSSVCKTVSLLQPRKKRKS
ncbi:hypothetical protein VTN31DRAFT_1131 [Thermomyces dupontii]|uniref:uncharacterized protein n=1 Tax=Talaromyces thermophilus TaxID=28565 RepID=UPI003742A3A7